MTVLEAGIVAGAFSGAAVGALLGERLGAFGGVGGTVAGIIVGVVAGWLFAMVLIGLLSFIGVLWRAARSRADEPLTESDISAMTPVAVAGTFAIALIGLAMLVVADWPAALAGVMASAGVTAFAAVARCEFRRA